MKCRQALKLLYEYLDNQLDNKTVEDVKQHLSECKHCFETYTFEEHLNDMIKEKSNESAPEAVDRLKKQVVHRIKQLSETEEESGAREEKGKSQGFFLFRRPVLAIGFMAVIAIIGFIAFLSIDKSNAWAEPFIQSHQSAVNGEVLMDVTTSNIDSMKICLNEKMPLPRRVFISEDDVHLFSGKVDLSHEKPQAQFLYEVNGEQVSIFVMRKSDFRRPGNMTLVPGTEGTYTFRYNGGCVYVWNCRDFWYVATSCLDDVSMMNFVSHFNHVSSE
jgi:mycothiol system anti-sigma-R factor